MGPRASPGPPTEGAFGLSLFGVGSAFLLVVGASLAALDLTPETTARKQAPATAALEDDALNEKHQRALSLLDDARPTGTPRPKAEPSAGARSLHALARRLKAPGAPIEDPCVAWVGADCARTALEPFFSALDRTATARGHGEHAVVVALGNSLIASDHITDIVRERLTERFGSAGRGFVLADRISDFGRRTRTGVAPRGAFVAHNFAMGDPGRFPFGVGGVLHVSARAGARSRLLLEGEDRVRVFFYDHPEASPFVVRARSEVLLRVEPEKTPRAREVEVRVPEGTPFVDVVAEGPGVVLYGASLEDDGPGVLWNTFGIPAAGASTFKAADAAIFREQLLAQRPSLVVVMLGGNETKRIHWGKRSKATVQEDFGWLLDKVRSDAPDAACLVVGPIDSVHGEPENPFRMRTHLLWVGEMQRREALRRGCAYLDLFRAMGGQGSLKRFFDLGLLHDDLVHPRRRGLDVLGQLVADALLDAYASTPRVDERALKARLQGLARGLVEAPGGLSERPPLPHLARVLAAPHGRRIALGLLSRDASTSDALASALVKRLGPAFGGASLGRVETAGGDPGRRVVVLGPHRRVVDAPAVVGQPLSLAGERLVLHPGARVAVALEASDRAGERHALEAAWLKTPESASLRLVVDGKPRGLLFPREPREGAVERARVLLPEGARSVVLEAVGDIARQEIHLLHLAVERKRPTLVVDAWAPPSLSALAGYNPDVLAAEARSRRYDLLLLLPSVDELRGGKVAAVATGLEAVRRGSGPRDCLLVSPLPKGGVSLDDEARRVAESAGCAFLSAWELLGLETGMRLFTSRGWLQADGTFTDEGAEKLVELLVAEVWAATKTDRPKLTRVLGELR